MRYLEPWAITITLAIVLSSLIFFVANKFATPRRSSEPAA